MNRHFEFYDPERDREAKFRLGIDFKAAATAYLAFAVWRLGEVERALGLMDEAVARARRIRSCPDTRHCYIAHRLGSKSSVTMPRRRCEAAETAVALCREHGIPTILVVASLHEAWARAKLGDRDIGSAEIRRTLEAFRREGNKTFVPYYLGLLASIEAEARGPKPSWPASTKRWRWRAKPENIGTTPNSIASAAKSCSNKTPPIRPPPKPPSSPPSPSRNRRKPAASNCAPRSRSPNSTNQPTARSKPTTSSAPRSKASRRRRSFRRSRRRRGC